MCFSRDPENGIKISNLPSENPEIRDFFGIRIDFCEIFQEFLLNNHNFRFYELFSVGYYFFSYLLAALNGSWDGDPQI